jgi:hypothetical protein
MATLGIDFENRIHEILLMSKIKVYREKDVKTIFGMNISAIDHLIFFDDKIICIQDKWLNTKPTVDQINHFVYCVNQINKYKKDYKCYGLYLSKLPLTAPSQISFDEEHFLNIHDENQDIIIIKLIRYLYKFKIWIYDNDNCCVTLND